MNPKSFGPLLQLVRERHLDRVSVAHVAVELERPERQVQELRNELSLLDWADHFRLGGEAFRQGWSSTPDARSALGARQRTLRTFGTGGELRLRGRACGYSSDRMALSSRKRIAPSLLVSAITKRTRPCFEVSA